MARIGKQAKERYCINALFLELIAAAQYPDEEPLGLAIEDLALIAAVHVAEMEKRALGGSQLATNTGLPRATAIRRLGRLVEAGLVIDLGKDCYKLNEPAIGSAKAITEFTRRARAAIELAARRLSNLDTLPLPR